MSEEEFLEILTDVFHEFEIKSSSYSKYNKDYTKFYIKKLVPRFKGKFSIAVVSQLLLGTTLFEDVWEIVFSFTNKSFSFRIEKDFERQSLEIMKEWYFEYEALSVKNNELLSKYSRIKNNFKEELRDHQLNKLL